MTRSKIRQLELAAGAPPRKGVRGIAGNKNAQTREAEREIARRAETAYRRTVNGQRHEKRCGQARNQRYRDALHRTYFQPKVTLSFELLLAAPCGL